MPHSHTADQPIATRGGDTEHSQPNFIKKTIKAIEATSFLFLSEMIAKIEKTHSTELQNKNQTQAQTPKQIWGSKPDIHVFLHTR